MTKTVPSPLLATIIICIVSSLLLCFASASSLVCPRQSKPLLLNSISPQCLVSSSNHSPLQMTGESLERALEVTSKRGDVYTSVLFYASWCPFSEEARMIFEVLSSMYPQIKHIAVEQSSVMPSLFSRYGIRSLPAIFIINQTSKRRFRGSKDLKTLIKFYKRKTGYEPLQLSTTNDFTSIKKKGAFVMQSWIGKSAKEIFTREPYLVLSLLFLGLQLIIRTYPRVLSYLRALRVSYAPHFNMRILGDRSQMFSQALHMMDVKRIWAKLRLCKNRNFHQGARNCRVWASSLASVTLGETSAARSASSCSTL